MSTENKLSSLESLEAYIESLKGDPSLALKKLEGFSDPDSTRRRLAILIESTRFHEAVESIKNLEPHEDWIDLATFVRAISGDLPGAKQCVAWAISRKEYLLSQKVGVRFVSGAMHWVLRARPPGSHVGPGGLSDEEIAGVDDVVTVVWPICEATLSRGRVDVELESQFLQQCLDATYLLGDNARASSILFALATRTPIPARVGTAFIQGIGKPDAGLVSRLWDENPKSFEARLVACVILGRDLNDPRTARQRVQSLTTMAKTQQQREDVCEVFYELLGNSAEGGDFAEIEIFTSDLLGAESPLLSLFRADRELKNGNHQMALALLEQVRNENDPRWLRSFANAKVGAGERTQALDIFWRLGSVIASPDVWLAAASLAKEVGQLDQERAALERAIALNQTNTSARQRLAVLLVGAKEYLKAAEHLQVLARQKPDDDDVVLNLAVSYALGGDTERALQVLVPKVAGAILPLQLLLSRALVLQGSGKPQEAFKELKRARGTYWEDPKFLLAYMDLGYASGEEREAHEALVKIQELRERGVVDDTLMRMVSMDEVKDWIRESAKRHDFIRQNMLQGKFPWIAAAQVQGEAPYWAWLLKTQPMDWIWDDPLNRASYTLYSTNSFRSLERDGTLTFEHITCPAKGTPVVVDLTALITLHSLGLIGDAAEFFGTLYVPAVYLSEILEDTRKLLPHQRSQRDAAKSILSKVAENRVNVLPSETDTGGQMPVIDEYIGEKDIGRLPLADLVSVLTANGFLNEQEITNAQAVSHRPATSGVSFALGRKIVIYGSTLVTLVGLGLLDVVTREFDVHIPKSDYDEFVARSRAFESLEQAHDKHTELWQLLRNDGRIKFAASPLQLGFDKEQSKNKELAVAATLLAKNRNLPLFADDRVCQMVLLNERRGDVFSAFGTDAFLVGAFKSGVIEPLKSAQLLLKLMEWRYRFVVMPPELLKALADQYRNNPPGLVMRRVAKYTHDCMSDTGLFAGLEQTTPPTSVAVRLYQSLVQNVGELLMDIWMDKGTSEAYAEEFTSWAIGELLPSPPRVLDERMQSRLATLTAMTVITRALIRSSGSTEFDRANLALRSIAAALGTSDAEYFGIVSRVIAQTNG